MKTRFALAVMLAAMSSLFVPASPVSAQSMREVHQIPGDCRLLLPPEVRGTVQPWQVYVALEHCDRIKRLQRLSTALPPDERPIFYEGIVPASRLPDDFGVDIPVLRVVFPERTFFDTARSEPRLEALDVAAIVSDNLRKEPPDVALFIAGHADRRGDRAMNEALSIKRANALAEMVVDAGPILSSVWRIGFGEDMPLIDGDTPAAYDRNRRVEFLFAAKPEAVAVWLADQQLDEVCPSRNAAEARRCIERLHLKDDYTVIEVKPKKERVKVRLKPPHPTKLEPPQRNKRGIDPKTRTDVSIAPNRGGLISVMPDGTRRISINPVSRRVAPVRIDL